MSRYPGQDDPVYLSKDVKVFPGEGATEEDLRCGYLHVSLEEGPEFDKANYHNRYSQPRSPDEDQGNMDILERDMEFRQRERVSKGFLTRPRIPTERG